MTSSTSRPLGPETTRGIALPDALAKSKEVQELKARFFEKAVAKKEAMNQWRFAFVSRTVIGAFVQQGMHAPGTKGARQLNSNDATFSAGTRELALIPNQMPPTHYHSEIAEITGSSTSNKHFRDTYYAGRGGCSLRFREIIVYKPTLLYPEYLVAYKRKNT